MTQIKYVTLKSLTSKVLIIATIVTTGAQAILTSSPSVLANPPADSANSQPNQSTAQSSQLTRPTTGTVEQMTNGDLMCYVTLTDQNNIRHQDLGASPDLCANQKMFLNHKVQATYQLVNVNDCQSAEPCGKTRQEWLIAKMEVLDAGNQSYSSDSQTLTNGKWTITIANLNSWSGVNGTGNLAYRGCDSFGRCLQLNGGRMTCRNGVCTMSWRNGKYWYVVEQPMDNPDQPREPAGATLTIRKGTTVILRATGFKVV